MVSGGLRPFSAFAFTLLAALYVYRGLRVQDSDGWTTAAVLTVSMGSVIVPLLAAFAASDVSWRRTAVIAAAILGVVTNVVLLAIDFRGFEEAESVSAVIIALWAAIGVATYRMTPR